VPLLKAGYTLSQTDMVHFIKVDKGVSEEDRTQRLASRLMFAHNLLNVDSDSDDTFLVDSLLLRNKHADTIVLQNID